MKSNIFFKRTICDLQLLRAQNEVKTNRTNNEKIIKKIYVKYLNYITDLVLRKAFKNKLMQNFRKKAHEEQSKGALANNLILGSQNGNDLQNY